MKKALLILTALCAFVILCNESSPTHLAKRFGTRPRNSEKS